MKKNTLLALLLVVAMLLSACTAKDTTSDVTPEPVQSATEAPAQDAAEEPAQDAAEEPAEETAEEPAEETAEEPADETAEEPADETAEEPADETAEEPAEEAAEEPADETGDETAALSVIGGADGATAIVVSDEAEAEAAEVEVAEVETDDENPVLATAYAGEITLTREDAQADFDTALANYISMYTQYGYAIDEYDTEFQAGVAEESVQLMLSQRIVEREAVNLGYELTDEKEADFRDQAQTMMQNLRDYYETYLSYYGYTGEELEAIVEEEILASGYSADALYESIRLNDMLDYLFGVATADVTVTDEEVAAAYEAKLATAQAAYADVDAYINDYLSGVEILYTPEGLRTVQCIYIAPSAEDEDIDDAQDEATADEPVIDEIALDEATASEPIADEATASEPVAEEATASEPVADEATASEPVADEMAMDEATASEPVADEMAMDEATASEPVADDMPVDEAIVSEPLADDMDADGMPVDKTIADEATASEPVADEATASEPVTVDPNTLSGVAKANAVRALIADGLDFGEAMTLYNEDSSSTEELEAGYPVAADSVLYDTTFVEGAMSLEHVGDVSDVIVTGTGCFILRYVSDLESGSPALDTRLETETAEALETKQGETFSAYISDLIDAADIQVIDLSPLYHVFVSQTVEATVAYASVSEETALTDMPDGIAVATLSAGASLDVLGHIGMDGEEYAFVAVPGTEFKGYVNVSALSDMDETEALAVDNASLVAAAEVPTKLPTFTIVMNDGSLIYGELYPDVTPETVGNFVELADSGYYDGLIFHRVIAGFMIQGGDPNGNGTGGPGYAITGEFASNGVTNDLSHTRGVLSMARSSAANSGGSQFFIMHADSPYLDGEYAGFGLVLGGIETVDVIASTPTDSSDRPLTEQAMRTVYVETYGQTYPFTKLED